MYTSLKSWVVGAMMCCNVAICSAAPIEIGSIGGQRMIKTTIELAGMNTEVRSIALGSLSNSLYLLVASRLDGEGHLSARQSIVSSDGTGNIKTSLLAPSLGGGALGAIPNQASLTFLAADAGGRPHMLTMAMNGNIQLHRRPRKSDWPDLVLHPTHHHPTTGLTDWS
jgi:hypothetical protein